MFIYFFQLYLNYQKQLDKVSLNNNNTVSLFLTWLFEINSSEAESSSLRYRSFSLLLMK